MLLFTLLSPSALRPRFIFQGQKNTSKICSKLQPCQVSYSKAKKTTYWHLFKYEGKIITSLITKYGVQKHCMCFVFLYVNKGIFSFN